MATLPHDEHELVTAIVNEVRAITSEQSAPGNGSQTGSETGQEQNDNALSHDEHELVTAIVNEVRAITSEQSAPGNGSQTGSETGQGQNDNALSHDQHELVTAIVNEVRAITPEQSAPGNGSQTGSETGQEQNGNGPGATSHMASLSDAELLIGFAKRARTSSRRHRVTALKQEHRDRCSDSLAQPILKEETVGINTYFREYQGRRF